MADTSIDYTGVDFAYFKEQFRKVLQENEGMDPVKAAKVAQLNIKKAEIERKMAPLVKQKAELDAQIAALSK